MGLSAGIVGLPNVGKSTLFNTITNSKVLVANYPFSTINPNVGIVQVNDNRLINLSNIAKSEKTTFATCTFVDIAGLVKDANIGEGLGNKFLSNIRDVDLICHVVRCFDDKEILHVYNKIDPIRDVKIINDELILSDLQMVETIISHSKNKLINSKNLTELDLLNKVNDLLNNGCFLNKNNWSEKELLILKKYNFLTLKPMIYISNVNSSDIANPSNNIFFKQLKEYIINENSSNLVIPLSISLEYEISTLKNDEKKEMLKEFKIDEIGLDILIKSTYKHLGLRTFFTTGEKETKAWTFKVGMSAPECAGIIHSDFQKGFIKAEICSYEDIMKFGSEAAVRQNGKMRLEGKNYIMQDGDVCLFKFNV